MRLVVALEDDQDPAPVADALRTHGAKSVQEPMEALPGVIVAEFPEGDPEGTAKAVSALPGVRYAEPDQMQSTDT
jgi:hypothetical protein